MVIEKLTTRCIRFKLHPLNRWDLYIYVILGKNKNYMIDTGCGSTDVKLILDYLKDQNLCKQLIVINTHFHWDHIWGNFYTGANAIISHKLCYDMIIENWDEMLSHNSDYISGDVKLALPTITFDNMLYIEEDNLVLFHSAGHTIDGICVYDEVDKVMYAGDNIGDDEEVIVPELMNTKEEYLKALQRINEFDYRYILSGHNTVQDKNFVNKIMEAVKLSIS